MLTNLTPRPYQAVLFNSASAQNTLVVLPTGLGKTAISMLLAARRAMLYPSSKILFLAPTKPLVQQQLETFKKHFLLSDSSFALFTGTVPPKKRAELWDEARFIFSTPQTIENDVLSQRISLEDVSLLVFDEAHRATGEYAYVFLAKEYVKQSAHQRILALTASPGTDKTAILEVMNNLTIEKIEFRKSSDPDVKEYVQDTEIQWLSVQLPSSIQFISKSLEKAYLNRIAQLKEKEIVFSDTSLSKTQLLALQGTLQRRIQEERSPELLMGMSVLAQALKLQHALELVQTQSLQAFFMYATSLFQQSRSSSVKAVKNIASDPDFLQSFAMAKDLLEKGVEHPKLAAVFEQVQGILQKNKDAKIIIFSQFRDSAGSIKKLLDQKNISSSLFFGQAKKNGVGFSQKKQKEVLDQFRQGEFTCLIATSVAEEGLDIPSVEQVIFYEPVPSAIRTVQRRGRTGRHTKGMVAVCVTKNTRDEAFRWVAHHKEKRMYQVLRDLQQSPTVEFSSPQKSLQSFTSEKESSQEELSIVVDYREKGSPVMKALRNHGVSLRLEHLQIGDYVVSKDVCVEYKRYEDFVDSITDGRLLAQIHQLAKYSHPILLVEYQDHNQSSSRRVDQNAIQGMFATIALSYKIPILYSFSPLQSAQLLYTLAKRSQQESSSSFSFHAAKPFSDKELLEYIASSFPQIGGVVAKSILDHFDSLASFFKASVKDLQQVPNIGKKKAEEIVRLRDLSYKELKKHSSL